MIIPILDIVIQVLVTLALLVLSSSALALEAATPDISIQTFAPNRAESPVGIVRYPDISAKQIVFAYNGELWLVPREGGIAASLTSSAGPQRFPNNNLAGPHFSTCVMRRRCFDSRRRVNSTVRRLSESLL